MKGTLLKYHQHYLRDTSLRPSENITGRISHCTLRLFAPALTSLTESFSLYHTSNIPGHLCVLSLTPAGAFPGPVVLLLSIEGNCQFEFSYVSKMSVLWLFY